MLSTTRSDEEHRRDAKENQTVDQTLNLASTLLFVSVGAEYGTSCQPLDLICTCLQYVRQPEGGEHAEYADLSLLRFCDAKCRTQQPAVKTLCVQNQNPLRIREVMRWVGEKIPPSIGCSLVALEKRITAIDGLLSSPLTLLFGNLQNASSTDSGDACV